MTSFQLLTEQAASLREAAHLLGEKGVKIFNSHSSYVLDATLSKNEEELTDALIILFDDLREEHSYRVDQATSSAAIDASPVAGMLTQVVIRLKSFVDTVL